jgi:hypothetical protein
MRGQMIGGNGSGLARDKDGSLRRPICRRRRERRSETEEGSEIQIW